MPKRTNNTEIIKPAVKSDIVELNELRLAKEFNGGLAVDADLNADVLTIAFVSTMGIIKSVEIAHPTYAAVSAALVKIVTDAHEDAKADLKANSENIILKAISSTQFLTPLKDNLALSSKDVKVAKEIKAKFDDLAAQKAKRIAELKEELASLEQ